MIRFVGTLEGVEVLNRAFNRVERFISDFRSIWPEVAKEFYIIEEGQFASEGARGASGKWAPLSPAYARWKAQRFPGEPILKLHHDLYESLTSPDAADSVYRLERDEMIIGSRTPYAHVHQKTRPPISMTEADKRKFQKSIQLQLVRFTREAGFQVEERAA